MQVQRKGKQDLRFMVLLFFLFLILYYIACYFTLTSLFLVEGVHFQGPYLIQSILSFIIWIFILVQLWKYSKLGKILFTFAAIVSLYTLKQIYILYQIPMNELMNQLIRVLFCFIVIGKNIVTLTCMRRLYNNKGIRCIWSLYDLGEEELTALDSDDHKILEIEQRMQPLSEQSKLSKKAKHLLRRNSIFLIGFLYSSLMVFYFVMFLIRFLFQEQGEAIDYIQRTILLASLYSAFIWSFPAIGMFLYKKWSKILVVIAWLFEFVYLGYNVIDVYGVFQTQHYGGIALSCYAIIQFLRYFIFIKSSLSLFYNPFIKTFWDIRRNVKRG